MKTKSPSLLERALQAQVAAIVAAKKIFDDAVQAAEDLHYAETREAQGVRRQAMIQVELRYDAEAAVFQKAWDEVFRRSLQAGFRDTRKETRAEREAKTARDDFALALPLLQSEIPAGLAGMDELLATIGSVLEDNLSAAGRALAQAQTQSAAQSAGEIPAARKAKERGIAKAKRKMEREKRSVEAVFQRACKKIDRKLAAAKATAQAGLELASSKRKAAWLEYQRAVGSAESALMDALS